MKDAQMKDDKQVQVIKSEKQTTKINKVKWNNLLNGLPSLGLGMWQVH